MGCLLCSCSSVRQQRFLWHSDVERSRGQRRQSEGMVFSMREGSEAPEDGDVGWEAHHSRPEVEAAGPRAAGAGAAERAGPAGCAGALPCQPACVLERC